MLHFLESIGLQLQKGWNETMRKQRVICATAAILMCAVVVAALWNSLGKSRSLAPAVSLSTSEAGSQNAASEMEKPASSEQAVSRAESAAASAESASSTAESGTAESTSSEEAEMETASSAETSSAVASSASEQPASSGGTVSSETVGSQSAAAHPSTGAASSHAASEAAHTATNEMKTAEELCDEKLAECSQRIDQLQTRMKKKLYNILLSAYDDYMAYPAEDRSLVLKVSVVLSKSGQLTAAQNECDAEFNEIIAEMRQTLRENGRSEAPADEAVKTYKKKKNEMIRELTDQAYSGGDGSGQSGEWLKEHASEFE